MYLSSLQTGLQSAHVTAELSIKYSPQSIEDQQYRSWAENHKTMIFLNGGNQQNLQDIETFLSDEQIPYAWSSFREDKESLNGCLTSVGIIVPARLYEIDFHSETQFISDTELNQFDIELLYLIKSLHLAR